MRITGGQWKGIVLTAPPLPARATTDRMRQAIFSSLGEFVVGAEVLDLFAGGGGVGIEALSRGANRATFVENARSSLLVLEKNLVRLDVGDRGRIHRGDVWKFLEDSARKGERWDLIFADPPYSARIGQRSFADQLLEDENLPSCLTSQGILVLETPSKWTVQSKNQRWHARVMGRRHGDSAFHVFEYRSEG